VIDDFSREALSITVDTSLPAQRVIRELEKLLEWRGKPEKIRSDNGPEFVAEAMRGWCEQNNIQWEFIQPGKPTQNSLIERFNRTFRQDVLDSYMFDSLPEIRKYAEAWAWMYHNERPHSSLGQLTPTEFLLKYGKHGNMVQRDRISLIIATPERAERGRLGPCSEFRRLR